MISKTISHYEMLSAIGEGGMGVVYRAVDTRLGRPVAVKLLRNEGAIDGESRKRFVQEARAASALNHPHIVTIYDIGQDAGVDFIAMEYVAGSSLASLISQRRLTIDDALKYAVQIADALSAAHAAGILHRDLKPGNIMISDKGVGKVLDFGLAKLTESTSDFTPVNEQGITDSVSREDDLQTAEGTILGTAAYMSPEQAQGKPADPRSDVFSFGAVLYEMFTGRRAFGGDTKMSTLAAILAHEPESPTRLVPDLPRDLEKLIARCLRKSPDRRWQSMADLKVALEDLREESDPRHHVVPPLSAPVRRWTRGYSVGVVAMLGIGAVTVAIWQTYRTQPGAVPRPSLTRLTSDLGWTDYPAISLDGKILAYASDRSGDGNLDIWVQHIPEGPPGRLTRHAADDVDPSFSADGSRIAFRSSRGGGGIYVMPTLGGEERLLASRGFSPRFSPDGNWIAYVVAEQGGGRIYVAPAAGGPATPVAAEFYRAQAPVWSPDGRHLLFWGQRHREAGPEDNVDWYVAAIPGGSSVATAARSLLLREGFRAVQGLPFPDAWVGAGNRILFHGNIGDSSNVWQVAVSPTGWRVTSSPERATFGTTEEAAASVTSDARMVFISRTMGADIWSMPIDAERGKPAGPLTRVTQDTADDYQPTLSEDGATMVFRSRRGGRFGVILKRLGSSAETVLTRLPQDHYPAISRDGTKVAYSFPQDGRMPIFVVDAGGGTPQQVCENCGEVEEWSARGDQILYTTQHDPSGIGLLTLGSSHNAEWLRHPGYGIYNPRLSSDGGWIAFNARTDRLSPARVFIAKVHASLVGPEEDWIAISGDADAPSWSPQANLLYFWSDRDGSPCLWAQRLDPATKQSIGAPLNIQHFHSRGLSWKNLYLGAPTIAVARDKIVFNLGEQTGNIWMTNLPRPRE
jgi:eukaryotic-like serine/threonine-protein kinase